MRNKRQQEFFFVILCNWRHLRHASRHYSLKSQFAAVWRIARAAFFLSHCTEFVRLPVVAQWMGRATRHDLFYHLTHRYYLATFLVLNERAEHALFHMRVEDRYFDDSYKQAVFLKGGLQLWEQVVDGVRFQIKLRMVSMVAQEVIWTYYRSFWQIGMGEAAWWWRLLGCRLAQPCTQCPRHCRKPRQSGRRRLHILPS